MKIESFQLQIARLRMAPIRITRHKRRTMRAATMRPASVCRSLDVTGPREF